MALSAKPAAAIRTLLARTQQRTLDRLEVLQLSSIQIIIAKLDHYFANIHVDFTPIL